MIINKIYPKNKWDKLTCEQCYYNPKTSKRARTICAMRDCTKEFIYQEAILPWYEAFCLSLDEYIAFIDELMWNRLDDYSHYIYHKDVIFLKDDIFSISVNILEYTNPKVTNFTNIVAPNKFYEIVKWILQFAYEVDITNFKEMQYDITIAPIMKYKLLSLEEQQEKCRNYIHFDFSVKNPKKIKKEKTL